MMVYTHAAFALLLAMLFENLHLVSFTTVQIAACLVGSIFPDIDSQYSYIGRKFPILPVLVNALGLRHRTATHSLLAIAIAGVSAWCIDTLTGWSITIAFTLGYTSHIFADMLNDAGVALLYPFKSKRYRILNIRTKSFEESLVFAGILFAIYFTVRML